jgi:hypothetical protein
VPPRIISFTVNPPNALAGQTVQLAWEADAAAVVLEVVDGAGVPMLDAPIVLQTTGIFSYVVPPESGSGAVLGLRLIARRATLEEVQQINVDVGCPVVWFFTFEPAQTGIGCPTFPAQFGQFNWQTFERGYGIYDAVNDRVYILTFEGQRVTAYPNIWRQTTPVPAGFVTTTGEIGAIWQNVAWLDGRAITQVIGLPIGAQQSYPGVVQQGLTADQYYVSGPDNVVYNLPLNGGVWTRAGRSN